MNTGKVRDAMSRQVRTAREEDDLEGSLQRMLWAGIRHLPVVRDGDTVVGVLSQRDVLEQMARATEALSLGHGSARQRVANAMRVPAETIGPDATLGEAARRMSAQRLGCLPVVEDGRLVGIVTATDLLAELGMSESLREVTRSPEVSAVMTRDPVTTGPGEPLEAAVGRMIEHGVRHLPVVDEDGLLVGIVSDRDIRAAVGHPRVAAFEGRTDDRVVSDVMTRDPVRLHPEQPILQAVGRFVDERVGALPVVDPKGRLVGIVSYLDVLRFLRGARIWGERDRATTDV